MVLPSEIFGGLDLIPTKFRFGILIAALDKKALAFLACQANQWGIVRRIAEGIVAFTIAISIAVPLQPSRCNHVHPHFHLEEASPLLAVLRDRQFLHESVQ